MLHVDLGQASCPLLRARLEPSSPLSRSARPYSPTRETWFGAADKECGVGARQRQAEQIANDLDKSRAKQHARVARMKHVGAQPAPATAPSVYPRGGKATPTRKQAPARRQADITPSPKKKTKKAQRPKGSPAKEQRRIFFGTLPEGWAASRPPQPPRPERWRPTAASTATQR